jgi:hypothetical protein
MTPGELASYVKRRRREQGFPPHVEDPSVLAAVAAMADDARAERGRRWTSRVSERRVGRHPDPAGRTGTTA